MNFEQILNVSVDDFVHSILFTVLHALLNAYTVKKSSPASSNLFRLAFSTIVLAMGGGILTNFLLGNPQTLFFSSRIIPVYTLTAWVMSGDSIVFREMENIPLAAKNLLFLLIDALSRGFALSKFLVTLRSTDCSIVGQFVLGTLAITGGGLLYNWFVLKNSYKIGGYPFNVICGVVLANIFFMEVMDSDKTSILHEIRVILENYNFLLPATETKVVTSYAIYCGFLLQPNIFAKSSGKPSGGAVKVEQKTAKTHETPKTPKSRTSSAKKTAPAAKKAAAIITNEESDASDDGPVATVYNRRSTRSRK
jgi:hypothetical protein